MYSTVHELKQECIPVGCILSAAVAICWWGGRVVCLSECWDLPPLGSGPGPPGLGLYTPLVWAWTPRCGPGTPLVRSPQPTPWVWAWRPPVRPPNLPTGCGSGDPSWPDPPTSPWVWAWRSPPPP